MILYLIIVKQIQNKMTSYKPTRTKGVYKTPSGKYRFRKMVKGEKISKYFTKYLEAVNFKKEMNNN